MRRALLLLARLEQQELDRHQQSLRAIDAALAEDASALERLREQLPAEMATGWALPGGPGLLAGYASGSRGRADALRQRQAELEQAREHAASAARERLAARRALELAAERCAAEREAAAARPVAAALEEAAARRAARGEACP